MSVSIVSLYARPSRAVVGGGNAPYLRAMPCRHEVASVAMFRDDEATNRKGDPMLALGFGPRTPGRDDFGLRASIECVGLGCWLWDSGGQESQRGLRTS